MKYLMVSSKQQLTPIHEKRCLYTGEISLCKILSEFCIPPISTLTPKSIDLAEVQMSAFGALTLNLLIGVS
jgi:hypothetical protein